jgi:hypothetical protein
VAYLNYLASVPVDKVERFRNGDVMASLGASEVQGVSHLIAYWVTIPSLREVLGEVIDDGEPLAPDLWHPFRAPVVAMPDVAKDRAQRLRSAWNSATAEVGPIDAGDWYAHEIRKVLCVYEDAERREHAVISALAPPHVERSSRVFLPKWR